MRTKKQNKLDTIKERKLVEVSGDDKGLALFTSTQLDTLNQYVELLAQKKELDTQEELLREQLTQAMEQYNLAKVEFTITELPMTVTYIKPSEYLRLDTEKAKEFIPKWEDMCSIRTERKAGVRIVVIGLDNGKKLEQ